MRKLLILSLLPLLVTACAGVRESSGIIASTGTILGIEGSQSPSTDTPQATIGYKRAEFTFVPATQIGEVSEAESCGRDANNNEVCVKDDVPIFATPNVLTEVYFKTLLQSTLYQRMAVGETAVQQGGAAIIFAKGPDGELDDDGAAAIRATQSGGANTYGCEESCEDLQELLNDDSNAAANLQALQQCMQDNGLGGIQVTNFVFGGLLADARRVCIEVIEAN